MGTKIDGLITQCIIFSVKLFLKLCDGMHSKKRALAIQKKIGAKKSKQINRNVGIN